MEFNFNFNRQQKLLFDENNVLDYQLLFSIIEGLRPFDVDLNLSSKQKTLVSHFYFNYRGKNKPLLKFLDVGVKHHTSFSELLKALKEYIEDFDEDFRHQAIGVYVNSLLDFITRNKSHQPFIDELFKNQNLFFTPEKGVYTGSITVNFDHKISIVTPKPMVKNKGLELNTLILKHLFNGISFFNKDLSLCLTEDNCLKQNCLNDSVVITPLIRESSSLLHFWSNVESHLGKMLPYQVLPSETNINDIKSWIYQPACNGIIPTEKGFIHLITNPSVFNFYSFSPLVPAKVWGQIIGPYNYEHIKNYQQYFHRTHLSGNLKRKLIQKEESYNQKDPLFIQNKFKALYKRLLHNKGYEFTISDFALVTHSLSELSLKNQKQYLTLITRLYSDSTLIHKIFQNYHEATPDFLVEEALEFFNNLLTKKYSDREREKINTFVSFFRHRALSLSGRVKLKGIFSS